MTGLRVSVKYELLILKIGHSPAMTPRTRWPLARNDSKGTAMTVRDKVWSLASSEVVIAGE